MNKRSNEYKIIYLFNKSKNDKYYILKKKTI